MYFARSDFTLRHYTHGTFASVVQVLLKSFRAGFFIGFRPRYAPHWEAVPRVGFTDGCDHTCRAGKFMYLVAVVVLACLRVNR